MADDEPAKSPADVELEKIAQWQRRRIEKKLKGEYESTLLHLSQIVGDNLDFPLTVSAVRVDGAVQTRGSFLESITRPYLPGDGATLEDVLHSARGIARVIERSNIFHPASTHIVRASHPQAPANAVDILVTARERGRFSVQTQTEFGANEGGVSLKGQVRNVFGGAETFDINLSSGTTTTRSFDANLSVPLSNDLLTRGTVSLVSNERDVRTWASCIEGLRGIRATLVRGSNALTYELMQRNIGSLSEHASLAMREEAGTSLKSSLKHTWMYDTRDDKIAGTSGFFVKSIQELAGTGLGGDAQFWKGEFEYQISRKLFWGVSASLGFQTGLFLPFSPSNHTYFSDRFQLGGPCSVRGFKMSGLGPQALTSAPSVPLKPTGPTSALLASTTTAFGTRFTSTPSQYPPPLPPPSDSLGGTAYCAAGLSVISDIPRRPHWPVKLHGWINGGALDTITSKSPSQLKADFSSLLDKPSVSAGLGLIYRFDPIRVEMNFGVPLAANKSDLARKGLQVGIGFDFL